MKKVLIAALIVTFIYLQSRLWFGHNSVSEINSLRAEIQLLEADIRAQRDTNDRLRSQVNALRETGDSDAMEEQIRERLGLIKDDETLFLFIRD